jgi:hypothetical protein
MVVDVHRIDRETGVAGTEDMVIARVAERVAGEDAADDLRRVGGSSSTPLASVSAVLVLL